MSTPLVSVIMTVYNGERYIEKSLQSISNQTFKDFEIVIYDDCSTDNTVEIITDFLRHYKGDYYFIFGEKNVGCGEGRSKAIKRSVGKYLAIQDADDISLPDRLERQVNFLEDNNDIFCIGSFVIKIDEEGEDCGEIEYPPENNDEVVKAITEKCMNPILDPTTMFRREDFDEIEGYSLDKSIWTVPDFDLWLRALLAGKEFHNIQEPLVRYRTNEEGVTRKHKEEMIRHHMIVWNSFMKDKRLK